jgi:hypothetical protein
VNTQGHIVEPLECRTLWSAAPVAAGHLLPLARPVVAELVASVAFSSNAAPASQGLAVEGDRIAAATLTVTFEKTPDGFSDEGIATDRGGDVAELTLKATAAGEFASGGSSIAGVFFDGHTDVAGKTIAGSWSDGAAAGTLHLSFQDAQPGAGMRQADDDADDDMDDAEEEGGDADGEGSVHAAATSDTTAL